MAIDGKDDEIHPRGPGSHYLENYLFAGLSDDSDVGFYLHTSRMFEVGLFEVHAAVFDGGQAITCLERHDLDEQSMRTASFTYEILEPLRAWRLVYDGHGGPGAFVTDPSAATTVLRFDITLRAALEPADMAEAFHRAGFGGLDGHHYEQGFEWQGEITLGERTVQERGLGLRDHSWGKRHMTEHNTTWWFPSVAPGSRVFYTGLEIRRGDRRMAAATRSDATATRALDDLGVETLAGDQVTYSRARLTYGTQPPALAHGVCRIPMPWLLGQGLPRLSDDLFCRVQMPDGSRGFGLVEMSRAATEAEQAGFRATVDTRGGDPGAVATAGAASRGTAARVRALTTRFPVDLEQFYSRGLPGHVERTVLASVLADLEAVPDIAGEAVAAYRRLAPRLRAALVAAGHDALVARGDALVARSDLRARADQPDLAAQWTALVAEAITALARDGRAGDVVGDDVPDHDALDVLLREAVAIDVRADRARTSAMRDRVGPGDATSEGSAGEHGPSVDVIDAAMAAHAGLPLETVRGTVTAGGLSKITLTYELEHGAFVVRADRGARYSGALVADEYRTITAAHRAGVPAPRPVAYIDALSGVHAGFSVVERVEGATLPGIPRFRSSAMCRQLADILAAVHRIPVDDVKHMHGFGYGIGERVVADLDARIGEWRAFGCANSFTEYAAAWLRRHVGDGEGPQVVLHGDYRPHNMLGVGDRITAVLDWEHSKIGNAAEDLAYVRPAVEALGSWPEFLDAYVAAGGRRPGEDELRFYDVAGALFNTTILDQMEVEFATEPGRPLTMIATVLQARPVMRARIAERIGLGA